MPVTSMQDSVACFTLLMVRLCDTRVKYPVLKKVSWEEKVLKNTVIAQMIKPLLRVKFIYRKDLKCYNPLREGQKAVVDLDPLFNGQIGGTDPRCIAA